MRSQWWGEVALFQVLEILGQNPALSKCLSSSLTSRIVPELLGAALGPCWPETFPQCSPTSPLLPASGYPPAGPQSISRAFSSKLRACLGHTPSQEGVPCPSSSLLSGFQGTEQDRRYPGCAAQLRLRLKDFGDLV